MAPKRHLSSSSSTSTAHKRRKLSTNSASIPSGALREWRPKDLKRKQELKIMRELRAKRDAPVDAFSKTATNKQGIGKHAREFQVLVSVFLSSQTRDEVTSAAILRLRQQLPGGLTISGVLRAREATLASLLKPVAFYNVKAKQLKKLAQVVETEHKGKVPASAEELCSLPGIGPKIAHVVVVINSEKPQGIGVDVHVHRICNQLGWVKSSSPDDTRKQLQRWLPYSNWADVNLVMVGLGQQLNVARSTLLRRSLELPNPLKALDLLERLSLDLTCRDKITGEGLLHLSARAGNTSVLKKMLDRIDMHKDKKGRWPWEGAPAKARKLLGH